MAEAGKHSRKLLEMAYPPEKYTHQGIDYLAKVLRYMSTRERVYAMTGRLHIFSLKDGKQ